MRLDANQIKTLNKIVHNSLQRLYIQDIELIQHGGMERSLSFRFGLYFNELIFEYSEFETLDVDLEYNKNGLDSKRTPRRPNGVQPDFILHKRRNNDQNMLVIEFKGWWNDTDRDIDKIKLEDFVSQDGEYEYGMGILVELNNDNFELLTYIDY